MNTNPPPATRFRLPAARTLALAVLLGGVAGLPGGPSAARANPAPGDPAVGAGIPLTLANPGRVNAGELELAPAADTAAFLQWLNAWWENSPTPKRRHSLAEWRLRVRERRDRLEASESDASQVYAPPGSEPSAPASVGETAGVPWRGSFVGETAASVPSSVPAGMRAAGDTVATFGMDGVGAAANPAPGLTGIGRAMGSGGETVSERSPALAASSDPVSVAAGHSGNVGMPARARSINPQPKTASQTAEVNTTNTGIYNAYLGSSYTVPAGGDAYDSLYVGSTATGTVTHSADTLTTANELVVGYNTGSNGTYTLSGTGSLSTAGYAIVGYGGTGTFNQSGGTFTTHGNDFALGYNTGSNGTYTLSGTGSLSMGIAYVGFSGTGTFTQSGGTFTTNLNALYLGYNAGSSGTYNLNGGTLTAGSVQRGSGTGTFNFNGGTLRPAVASTTFLQGLTTANVRNGGAKFDTNGFNVTVAQPLVHSTIGGDAATDGGLTKLGGGTLTLSGANTYTGATTVSAGVLQAGAASAFGVNSAVSLANASGTTLALNGFNVAIGSLSGGGATGGNVTLGAGTLTVGGDNTSPAAFAGVISGTGGLTKLGSGTLTLTGANTYTGGTTFGAGTINAGSAGALGSSGTLSFSGGTLQYSAANQTDYSGRFSTAVNQAYKIDTNGQAVTFVSALTSSGGTLTKTGTGTLTLSGANTYTGNTNVSAGGLSVSNDGGTAPGRLANTGVIVVNNGGTLLLAGVTTVTDRLNNAAAVTINGGGKLTMASGLREGAVPTAAGGAGGAVGLGALTLASTTSALRAAFDFGNTAGGSALVFSSLNAAGKGAFVSILDWSGTVNADNGASTNDRLLFLTDPGFTRADLANWQFSDDAGNAFITGGLEIAYNGYYEIVPVPEPGTWAAGLLASVGIAGAGIFRRRRPAGRQPRG